MKEVEAIRASLEFVAQAPEVEASEELTAGILLSAQTARRAADARRQRRDAAATLVKSLASAAGIVVVASLYFGAALDTSGDGVPTPQAVSPAKWVADSGPSLEAIRKTVTDLQTLAAAVNAPSNKPATLWEREHRRAVHVLDGDIAAALAALERNPGCTRAANLVNANLERQADTLRTLYIERSL